MGSDGLLSLRFDPTLRLGNITADKRLYIFYQMKPNVENGTIAQGSARDSICNKTKKKFFNNKVNRTNKLW